MDSVKNLLVEAIQLQDSERFSEALVVFKEILNKDPNNIFALFSMGLLLMKHYKDYDSALELSTRGVEVAPGYAPIHALHANILHQKGFAEEALGYYLLAIDLDKNYVTALINASALQQQLSQHSAALINLQRVLELEPHNKLALANCGTLLTEFKRNEEAISLFRRLLDLDKGYDFALGMLAFEKLHICDWSGIAELRSEIIEGICSGKRTTKTFPLMALCDDPEILHRAACIFSESAFPRATYSLWNGEKYQHDKIKIAYISADFREHPVGHLIAGVIERHDKNKFEVIGISLGIDDGSKLRERFVSAFDQFFDVQKLGSLKIAELIKSLEVDIAINLSGYTSGSRSEVFAYRVAPIQVNYLGYPGTMGADYIDYILVDRHIAPFSEQRFYTEKIVHLPNSYLPTDSDLKVAQITPPRVNFGLPEEAFVFCSFNHDYKISPEIFSIWMRLLNKVEGSVLWLMKLNEPAQKNLCNEAKKHGIDPGRLIFATRVPSIEDHLARYRHADLFLDCYPYNAHTTAADDLFVGLPVLTYMGNVFQGRVAGSLLSTLEMHELITHSLESYERKAYELATNKSYLKQVKDKLLGKIASTPLYKTDMFCQHIEMAYERMWERWQLDLAPEGFAVADISTSSSMQSPAPIGRLDVGLRKLHIGGKVKCAGWEVLNAMPAPYVDHVCNANNLNIFSDNCFSEIYASHIVEHLDYKDELASTLSEWFRVLKPKGRIYISVPDLDVLCSLMLSKSALTTLERFMIMRMMFGGHVDKYDYHVVGLNEEFLTSFLTSAGFCNIRKVSEFGIFDDTSSLKFKGIGISLNIIAEKP